MRKLKFISLAFVSILFLTNCEKEVSLDLTGDLKIIFSNGTNIDYNNVSCYIYTAENRDLPLESSIHPDSAGIISLKGLNHGNYVFEYYYGEFFVARLFQISSGELTILEFDLPG